MIHHPHPDSGALPPIQLTPANPPFPSDPHIAHKMYYLALLAFPHYTMYPTNPSFTTLPTANYFPLQPWRPPFMVPMHPAFVYFGRDLSCQQHPLPAAADGRYLFVRLNDGNHTDEGFGPGVAVHPLIKEEVARAEERLVAHVVTWDGERG